MRNQRPRRIDDKERHVPSVVTGAIKHQLRSGIFDRLELNLDPRCKRAGYIHRHSPQLSGCRVPNARCEIGQTDSRSDFSGPHDIRDTRTGDLLCLGNSRSELKGQ